MIDLTLDGFLHPDILGLSPQFGTIITRDAENKGGLSTAQTDINMGLPFSLMRPVPVSSSDTTSQIEFDAKILITGSAEVAINLDKAVYEGCRLTITNRASESAIITGEKIEGVAGGRINLGTNCVLELNYTESDGWIYSNSIVGEIRILTETDAPAGWLICDGTEYNILQYPRLAQIMLKLPFNKDVSEGRFRVVDMREVVPVGTGENSSYTITDHDVYVLGEFKDDQIQDHTHLPNGLTGGRIHNGRAGGSAQTEDSISTRNTGKITSDYRKGTSTHGKQIGVNYIIKY